MYLVYCLVSQQNPSRTYVGVTNNWARRLRQHNGEITGGAKTTRAYRPWTKLIHVYPLTKQQALRLEWAWKHRRRGGGGPGGRIKTLEYLLQPTMCWTAKCGPTSELSLHVDTTLTRDEYARHAAPVESERIVRNWEENPK